MHAPRVDVDRLQLPGHTAGRLCSMLRMPIEHEHEHEHEQSMQWAGRQHTYVRTHARRDAMMRRRAVEVTMMRSATCRCGRAACSGRPTWDLSAGNS
jgi:hypothetical protein